MEQFGSNNGDPLNMRNSRERQWSIEDDNNRMQQELHDSQQANAQLMRKAEEDRQFQQNQNDFARTFGRGLTSGPASTRGQAGQTTQVPSSAIPKQQTYWENNAPKQNNNRVELAGMMNRGAQQFAGGDEAGKDLFLKGYNDGPWSSATDATDMTIDENGGVTLFRGKGDGKSKINGTPIPMEELQNIVGNQLTGQNVYQTNAGAGRGGGGGKGLMQPQSKSAVKAADVVGSAKIDQAKAEIKALSDRASLEKMTPELQAEMVAAEENYNRVVQDAGSNIYGAGLQGQMGQRRDPATDLKGLMDAKSGISDDEIRQTMLDNYGQDGGVMKITESALRRRQGNRGLKEPKAEPKTGPKAKQQVTKDNAKMPEVESRARMKVEKEKRGETKRKERLNKITSDRKFKSEGTYRELRKGVEDGSLTVKDLNKKYDEASTVFQKNQIERLLEQAISLEK